MFKGFKSYKAFIDSLSCIDGVVCKQVPAWVPGSFGFYDNYYVPVPDFGLLASDMVIGARYMSAAFDTPVVLIDYIDGFNDGGAACTVLYKGGLYTDCSFRMAKYN
jgi:hypothetical protein